MVRRKPEIGEAGPETIRSYWGSVLSLRKASALREKFPRCDLSRFLSILGTQNLTLFLSCLCPPHCFPPVFFPFLSVQLGGAQVRGERCAGHGVPELQQPRQGAAVRLDPGLATGPGRLAEGTYARYYL